MVVSDKNCSSISSFSRALVLHLPQEIAVFYHRSWAAMSSTLWSLALFLERLLVFMLSHCVHCNGLTGCQNTLWDSVTGKAVFDLGQR